MGNSCAEKKVQAPQVSTTRVLNAEMDRVARLQVQYEKTGFPFRVEPYDKKRIRITMWTGNRKPIQTVYFKASLGIVLLAMRQLLNKGNFCKTCGGVINHEKRF